jgi:ferredoxin-NADP reductase
MIMREIGDCRERLAYVSGPRTMVDEMVALLRDGIGLAPDRVRYEYFPGFEESNRAA